MKSFLNLLCHELVLSTTHLFGEYFLRFGIAISLPSSPFFPFFFLIGMCSTYPRLINSCSSSADLYPLSRHRCCNRRRRRLDLDNDFGLFIAVLSTTSVTNLISWVLAGDSTTDRGIPFLSVKMCLFVQPSLLLSVVGLFPVLAPLKVTLWICYLWIARSSWDPFYHHSFLIVWSMHSWIHPVYSILEISCDKQNQSHILLEAYSTGILF